MLILYFRDALSDLALHFLNKMKIMVVKDIEREDIEFICKVKYSWHLYVWKYPVVKCFNLLFDNFS